MKVSTVKTSWNAPCPFCLVLEGKGSAKAPITADHDKPVDSVRAHAVGGGGADQGIEELRATRSTDDRAATLDDVPHSPVVQFGELPRNVAGKPVDVPRNRDPPADGGADNRSDGGVHPGRIAPAGEDSEALHPLTFGGNRLLEQPQPPALARP